MNFERFKGKEVRLIADDECTYIGTLYDYDEDFVVLSPVECLDPMMRKPLKEFVVNRKNIVSIKIYKEGEITEQE